MDRSLPRLTPHLAEARGGQGPLVAGDISTACPKNHNRAAVDVKGAPSGAENQTALSYVF